MAMGGKRARAEQAGTFVERGPDVTGFVGLMTPHSTPTSYVRASKNVSAPAMSSVSTNVTPTKQVMGVKPSYSVTPGGPYTGGTLKI